MPVTLSLPSLRGSAHINAPHFPHPLALPIPNPSLSRSLTKPLTPSLSTMKGKADSSKKGEAKLKASGGAGKRKKAAASGKPKRPPSAFFVFMSEFRQQFQEKNPNNKSVAAVSKAAGEKWRAMSDEEKEPYVAKAGKKKQDYEKNKATFNKKESSSSKKAKTEEDNDGGEGSDKSKSEVDDEQDGSEEDEEEEE